MIDKERNWKVNSKYSTNKLKRKQGTPMNLIICYVEQSNFLLLTPTRLITFTVQVIFFYILSSLSRKKLRSCGAKGKGIRVPPPPTRKLSVALGIATAVRRTLAPKY